MVTTHRPNNVIQNNGPNLTNKCGFHTDATIYNPQSGVDGVKK